MALDSITFWINAFIPNSVCVEKNGIFVLPIPDNPIPTLRFFAGDQREFSSSQQNICGESTEVDESGNVIKTATASSDRMHFANLRGSQTVDPEGGVIDGVAGSVQIDLFASANLPLLAIGVLPSPDIDYSGTLIIDRAEGNVLFKGAVSGFPAFEIYYQANDGPIVTLSQMSPIMPFDLIGPENRSVDVNSRIQINN